MKEDHETTELDKIIGGNAKRIRREKGDTQEAIAEVLKCEQSYLSLLENGRRAWTTKWMERFCRHYNIHPAILMNDGNVSEEEAEIFKMMKRLIELRMTAPGPGPDGSKPPNKKKPK